VPLLLKKELATTVAELIRRKTHQGKNSKRVLFEYKVFATIKTRVLSLMK
jgi:hypothetical protein